MPIKNDQNGDKEIVILVDDDVLLRELQTTWLEEYGLEVHAFGDGESCLASLGEVLPDAICLDLMLPGIDGIETLRRIKAHNPVVPVILSTAAAGVETAVEAMKLGAYNYFEKPVERPKFLAEVSNAIEKHRMSMRLTQLEREADGRGYTGIVGQSAVIKKMFRRLDRIAPSDITVLIMGESGTGKELVAQAIHRNSPRHKGNIIALSCAAIPENLQESELFGHEKGAFTGAASRRLGAFERADGGTLFLDEIGELSQPLQAKLLRVLQERSFQRVGGSTDIYSDFRLMAATHRDLREDVEAGRFREDLYFRVAVMELTVPPLRRRLDDVPLLVTHFLEGLSPEREMTLSRDALEVLAGYDWPGNVRELRNVIERAMVEADGDIITPACLPSRLGSGRALQSGPTNQTPSTDGTRSPPQTLAEIERAAIESALARADGNMAQVVRELGIGRTTLYRKLRSYGLR